MGMQESNADRSELGAHLRALRESKGYSMRDAAILALTSHEAIRRFEAGESSPKLEVAMRLAIAYGVTLDELMPKGYIERMAAPESVLEWLGRRVASPARVSGKGHLSGVPSRQTSSSEASNRSAVQKGQSGKPKAKRSKKPAENDSPTRWYMQPAA